MDWWPEAASPLPLANKVKNIDRAQVWAYLSVIPKSGHFVGNPDAWYLQLPRVHIPKTISICTFVLAQLTLVTNRKTDIPRYRETGRPRYCGNNRLHLMLRPIGDPSTPNVAPVGAMLMVMYYKKTKAAHTRLPSVGFRS